MCGLSQSLFSTGDCACDPRAHGERRGQRVVSPAMRSGLAAVGCGGNPPAVFVGESQHFRLYVDPALMPLPAAFAGDNALAALETQWSDVATMLDMPDGKIIYYWYTPEHVGMPAATPGRRMHEGSDMEIDAPLLPDAHELNHAYTYLRSPRRPIPFLAEGMAEAIGCGREQPLPAAPNADWRTAAAGVASADVYGEGGLLVRHLIRTQGIDAFLRYYEQSPERRDPALFGANFESFWGMPLDDVWTDDPRHRRRASWSTRRSVRARSPRWCRTPRWSTIQRARPTGRCPTSAATIARIHVAALSDPRASATAPATSSSLFGKVSWRASIRPRGGTSCAAARGGQADRVRSGPLRRRHALPAPGRLRAQLPLHDADHSARRAGADRLLAIDLPSPLARLGRRRDLRQLRLRPGGCAPSAARQDAGVRQRSMRGCDSQPGHRRAAGGPGHARDSRSGSERTDRRACSGDRRRRRDRRRLAARARRRWPTRPPGARPPRLATGFSYLHESWHPSGGAAGAVHTGWGPVLDVTLGKFVRPRLCWGQPPAIAGIINRDETTLGMTYPLADTLHFVDTAAGAGRLLPEPAARACTSAARWASPRSPSSTRTWAERRPARARGVRPRRLRALRVEALVGRRDGAARLPPLRHRHPAARRDLDGLLASLLLAFTFD